MSATRGQRSSVARRFGASPGKITPSIPHSNDPRQQELARHIVRYAAHAGVGCGLRSLAYIGEGGAPPGQYRMDMIHLPKGVAVRGYARPVEDVYFVLEGCITVGWEEAGHTVEHRLGPRDVIFNPAGRVHYFRNDGVTDAMFMMLAGTARAQDVRFQEA